MAAPSAARIAVARLSGRRRPAFDGWGLLLVPAVLFIGFAFVLPVEEILRRSFTDVVQGQPSVVGNYEWFFSTPVNVTVLRRTFVTGLLVTAICLALAYPYAYQMTRVGGRWRLVMIGLVLLPFWTSLMVRNYAWVVLLQDNGPINDALSEFGLGRLEMLGTVTGVTIGMVQILLPFMVLPLYAVMQGIDRRLLLAAQSLGAPPHVGFLRVYVPLSLPGVLAGSLLVFVLALGFYITPALLGSPQQSLLSQLMYNQVSELLAFGPAGAMAGVLLAVAFTLVLVVGAVVRRSPVGRGMAALEP